VPGSCELSNEPSVSVKCGGGGGSLAASLPASEGEHCLT
jgi:hypothetical protein